MTTEPLATNAHHKGVSPEDMAKSGLDEMFRWVELSRVEVGLTACLLPFDP